MRRSKLEMYIDILHILAHRGPLKITHIMYKANVNCATLNGYMDFLIKQGLIEEKNIKKNKRVYAITQRGMAVVKSFRELRQALPIVEENEGRAPILY